MALKLLGAATGGSIMMFDETVPAGTKSTFYLHHDSDKVAYVLSGEVRFSRAKPRGVTARHSLPLSGGPGGVVGKVYVDRFCDQDARVTEILPRPECSPKLIYLPHLICAR